jgi:hydroxymethylpyrimidine/phosphomethylpyrimidine kinase
MRSPRPRLGPCQYCCAVTPQTRTPRALSIAGSDSGGGAGVQADLKAFARCGVHGMTAITAITAQSTTGVEAVHMVPPEMVLAQVRVVVADVGVDAVKVGMLGTVEVTLAVARALDELPPGTPVVVDPVMVAESGARLLREDAQRALVEEIVPRATVLTPNLAEARALAGGAAPADAAGPIGQAREAQREDGEPEPEDARYADIDAEDADARELARAVLALGPRIVVLTGGHRVRAVDLFVDSEGGGETIEGRGRGVREGRGGEAVEIEGERHADGAAHGSGCTHSAVLAAHLALGRTPLQAARAARRLAGEAVAHGLSDIGAGAGPVDVLGLERLRSGIIEER